MGQFLDFLFLLFLGPIPIDASLEGVATLYLLRVALALFLLHGIVGFCLGIYDRVK